MNQVSSLGREPQAANRKPRTEPTISALDRHPMRVLVIEDHQRLAKLIVEGLAGFGIGADTFPNAEDGLAATKSISYDALVLDLGLPDRDGLDVIQELRAKSIRTPILILTARGGIDERVEGLDRGADDYLPKPFAMKELAARLRALLRRPGGPLGTTIDIANLRPCLFGPFPVSFPSAKSTISP